MTKILLAEDEEVLRMLVVDTLEDEGYDIDEASDGAEALDYIHSNDYDLILLDYMMPVHTGLELIGMVRNIPEKAKVKIVMLSAKSQASDQQRVLEAGADYFISKPFSPMDLLEKVQEILSEGK